MNNVNETTGMSAEQYQDWLDECYKDVNGPSFEDDVFRLVRLVNHLLLVESRLEEMLLNSGSVHTVKDIKDAVEAVEAWNEEDDPRAMGWVDDRGRP